MIKANFGELAAYRAPLGTTNSAKHNPCWQAMVDCPLDRRVSVSPLYLSGSVSLGSVTVFKRHFSLTSRIKLIFCLLHGLGLFGSLFGCFRGSLGFGEFHQLQQWHTECGLGQLLFNVSIEPILLQLLHYLTGDGLGGKVRNDIGVLIGTFASTRRGRDQLFVHIGQHFVAMVLASCVLANFPSKQAARAVL